MDRYQFEDLISEYLENTLSLSKRKEFESYLEGHPEAREEVSSVQKMMQSMKSLNDVKTSPEFMKNLRSRIASENIRTASTISKRNTYFGFTPLYASLFGVLIIALLVVGVQLIPSYPGINPAYPVQQPMAEETTNTEAPYKLPAESVNNESFAEAPEDSVELEVHQMNKNNNFEKGIQLVKNPR